MGLSVVGSTLRTCAVCDNPVAAGAKVGQITDINSTAIIIVRVLVCQK